MFNDIFVKSSKYFRGLQINGGVEVAYLFGSVAKGKARSKSDVDVAVLFSSDLTREERLDKQLALAGELASYLRREVDVVDLAVAPLILQHQVLKYGKCVFERDPRTRVAFEVSSRRDYFDMKPVWDRHTAGMLKSMEKGEFGGKPGGID